MSTIAELTLKYNCDKSSQGHNYGVLYDKWFEPLKESVKNILEIGVFIDGRSLCVWNDYFPNALIYGIDIIDPLSWDKIKDRERVVYSRMDQGDQKALDGLAQLVGEPFDIIIDDGSHNMHHQQLTMKYMLKYVRPGGIYVVEDLHTSYYKNHYQNEKDVSTQQMLKDYAKTGKLVSPYYTEEDQKMFDSSIEVCVPEPNKGVYDYTPDYAPLLPTLTLVNGKVTDNCSICFIRKK